MFCAIRIEHWTSECEHMAYTLWVEFALGEVCMVLYSFLTCQNAYCMEVSYRKIEREGTIDAGNSLVHVVFSYASSSTLHHCDSLT